MLLEEALYDWLSADTGISALVGNRIFPNKIPQGETYPQITFFRVSSPRVRNFGEPDGLANPRIQVDCWGLTLASAVAVGEAVRNSDGGVALNHKLDGFRGTMGDSPGVTIQSAQLEDERHTYNAPQHDDDKGVHQVSQDYMFWWEES